MDYLARFGKSYESKQEFAERMNLFLEKDLSIAKLNEEHPHTKFAHNKFSDWHDSEYKKLLGYGHPKPQTPETPSDTRQLSSQPQEPQ